MVNIPKIPIKELNSNVKALSNIANFDQIQSAAKDVTKKLQSATTTTLGATAGQSVGGWESLTQEIDDIEIGVSTVSNRGLALLQSSPPGVNLVNEFSDGAQDALQSITGLTSEIAPGLNSVVHSLPTPEAVGASISDVSAKPLAEVSAAMEELAPAQFKSIAASSSIGQLTDQSIFKEFTNTVSSVNDNIDKFLNTGFDQILKDVVEATVGPIGTVIEQLTQDVGKIIPKGVSIDVTSFLDKGDFLSAAETLNEFSNFDISSLETELSQIDTSMSSLIDKTDPAFAAMGVSTSPVSKIGELDGNWSGNDTPVRLPGTASAAPSSSGSSPTTGNAYSFTFISSKEELEAELRSATREITEVVIHWTGNYIDQPHIGADDVHQWHLDRGWSGCGYHYIIKRDGTIQRGRPINIQGAHANNLGHNRYSIGISHVAGYNCASGTSNPNRFISAESISDAQWKAQKDFLEVFYRVFPGGQVLGHNQTDTIKIDPGFDVDAYILNTFNKKNAVVYNRDRGPLSRSALLDARRNGASPTIQVNEPETDINLDRTDAEALDTATGYSDAEYKYIYGPNADQVNDELVLDGVYNGEYNDGEIVDFQGSKYKVVQTSEETEDFYAGYDLVPL